MTIYARVDKKGIIRCGCPDKAGRQTCLTRFGEVLTVWGNKGIPGNEHEYLGVRLDVGWNFDELGDAGVYLDGCTIALTQWNLARWQRAKRRRELDTWKAIYKVRWPHTTHPAVGDDSWYWIVCPEHGRQIIDGTLIVDAARGMLSATN